MNTLITSDTLTELGLLLGQREAKNKSRTTVALPTGKSFVIKIGCFLNQIPEGVQVGKVTSGAQCPQDTRREVERFNNATIDQKSLLPRIDIDSINVIQSTSSD